MAEREEQSTGRLAGVFQGKHSQITSHQERSSPDWDAETLDVIWHHNSVWWHYCDKRRKGREPGAFILYAGLGLFQTFRKTSRRGFAHSKTSAPRSTWKYDIITVLLWRRNFPPGQQEYWRNSLPSLHLSWNGGWDLQTDYSYHIVLLNGDIYSFNKKLVLQKKTLFIPFIQWRCQTTNIYCMCPIVTVRLCMRKVPTRHWNAFVAFLRETIERGDLLRISDIWLRVPLSSLWGILEDTEGVDYQPWYCWFTFLSDRWRLTLTQYTSHLRVHTCSEKQCIIAEATAWIETIKS